MAELTSEDFDRVFHTNVRGQLPAAQSAVRHMGAGGRAVLTSSISARRVFERHTRYSASKAAVEAVVLNLAAELGRRGITIKAIAPGAVTTDMSASAEADYFPGADLAAIKGSDHPRSSLSGVPPARRGSGCCRVPRLRGRLVRHRQNPGPSTAACADRTHKVSGERGRDHFRLRG
nr:SDR family oxidoreductase [Amycolatopsis australiensis]